MAMKKKSMKKDDKKGSKSPKKGGAKAAPKSKGKSAGAAKAGNGSSSSSSSSSSSAAAAKKKSAKKEEKEEDEKAEDPLQYVHQAAEKIAEVFELQSGDYKYGGDENMQHQGELGLACTSYLIMGVDGGRKPGDTNIANASVGCIEKNLDAIKQYQQTQINVADTFLTAYGDTMAKLGESLDDSNNEITDMEMQLDASQGHAASGKKILNEMIAKQKECAQTMAKVTKNHADQLQRHEDVTALRDNVYHKLANNEGDLSANERAELWDELEKKLKPIQDGGLNIKIDESIEAGIRINFSKAKVERPEMALAMIAEGLKSFDAVLNDLQGAINSHPFVQETTEKQLTEAEGNLALAMQSDAQFEANMATIEGELAGIQNKKTGIVQAQEKLPVDRTEHETNLEKFQGELKNFDKQIMPLFEWLRDRRDTDMVPPQVAGDDVEMADAEDDVKEEEDLGAGAGNMVDGSFLGNMMDGAKNVLGGAFGNGNALGGGAAGVEGVHVAAPPADAGSAGDGEPAANFYSQAQSNNSPGPAGAADIEEEDVAMEEAAAELAAAEEAAAPAAEEAAAPAVVEEAAAPAAVEGEDA